MHGYTRTRRRLLPHPTLCTLTATLLAAVKWQSVGQCVQHAARGAHRSNFSCPPWASSREGYLYARLVFGGRLHAEGRRQRDEGGYPAGGGTRNITANVTTLSGALSAGVNSRHVVVGADSALLDGFTVRDGNAVGTESYDTYGGGVFCYNISLTLANCIICNNSATYGAGLYGGSATLTVNNCTFLNNTSTYEGGGIYCASSDLAVGTAGECVFQNNTACTLRRRDFLHRL